MRLRDMLKAKPRRDVANHCVAAYARGRMGESTARQTLVHLGLAAAYVDRLLASAAARRKLIMARIAADARERRAQKRRQKSARTDQN